MYIKKKKNLLPFVYALKTCIHYICISFVKSDDNCE